MPSHGSRSMTASDQSDLKKLKSRYSSQLATLRELFADWSDDDLLFALQEVEGDLDLAIDRISEGHVSQWGEVKSRKSKKEAAQKAKAAAAPVPPSSSNQMSSSSSSYRPERTQPPRGNNDRSKRGGRHGSRGQRQPTTQSQAPAAATWGTSAPTKSFQPDNGSWASIASTKMNDKGWNANTESGSGWDAAAAPNTTNGWDDKEPTQEIKTESEEKPASTTAEAKTWASLLKSKPKPVEPEQPKQEPEISEKSGWDEPKDAAKDGWDTKDEGGWDTKDNWDNKDSWDAPSVPADPWTSSTTEPVQESVEAAEAPKESEPEPVNEPEQHVDTTTTIEDETPKEEPVPKKSSVDRRPKQDAPVVLPNNGTSSLSSIGVKFGSLTLDDNAENNNEINNTTTLQAEMRVPDEIQQPSQPQQERLDTFATAPLQSQQQAPQQQQQQQQPLASEPVPQQQQAPIHQQPQHTLPQQPLFGMDHLASGYSSYLPNQPPAGVSGFGVSPMGSLPDYGLYGTDAHRAAMLQGYYDPAAVYNQSPSATHAYQPRDKQDGVPQHSGAQTPGATAAAAAAAQMYPMNMPYYQYYYMPSQFGYQQNAAAAAYGQPFMNKSMYPNMYQQGTAKPNAANPAGTATSPYGAAAASPYSQTMYSAAMSAGYDDMTAPGAGLQHNLGGLQDYQKMYQQQLPGFLGGAQQQQPPMHHHQQPSQQPPQQPASATGNKNDKAGNAAGGAGGSNGHHHHAQQQQQPYPGNYFGGSFPTSYQQQYPQQQQQQQHFPHFPQQQQQQAPAAQQPSPMGRQQPYWSQ